MTNSAENALLVAWTRWDENGRSPGLDPMLRQTLAPFLTPELRSPADLLGLLEHEYDRVRDRAAAIRAVLRRD